MSQYVLMFESQTFKPCTNLSKAYTLMMPRCSPDSLRLKYDIADLTKKFACSFKVVLLLQLETDTAEQESAQYLKIKEHFKRDLEPSFISPLNEGLWCCEPETVYKSALSLYKNNELNVVSVWGDWSESFRNDSGL